MGDAESDSRLAVTVVDSVPLENRQALQRWAERLLVIRETKMPALRKAKAAIDATVESRVIWPTIKFLAKRAKQAAWDSWSGPARAFIGVAAVTATVFGGKAAGVAALGTAVGVPLWVVFGAGAGFAAAVVKEVRRRATASSTASYTVIDAERRPEQ